MDRTVTEADGSDSARPNGSLLPDILRAIPDPVIVSDAGGRILLVNPAVERTFGYEPQQLIGQDVEILVPHHLRRRHRGYRAAYLGAPTVRPMGDSTEMTAVRADGTEFPVAISLGFAEWDGRQIVIATVLDFTKRKERADRSKNQFIATVSHELRTPLTAIMGSLALVTNGAAGPLPDRAAALLKTASASCQRLIRLVNDILDLEKTESGRMAFDWKPIDVPVLLEQQIETNRVFAAEYGVQLQLDCAAEHATVRADADRLSQVITNLVSNAIRFSPRGAEVTVTVETLDDTVRISVRDQGPGIPNEFKDRIFEKFFQANVADKNHHSGTGLGLSIVKQITERLGGEVGFEPAPGGGANFYVKLPQWKSELTTAPAANKRQLRACDQLRHDEQVA